MIFVHWFAVTVMMPVQPLVLASLLKPKVVELLALWVEEVVLQLLQIVYSLVLLASTLFS